MSTSRHKLGRHKQRLYVNSYIRFSTRCELSEVSGVITRTLLVREILRMFEAIISSTTRSYYCDTSNIPICDSRVSLSRFELCNKSNCTSSLARFYESYAPSPQTSR
jgi:hypothetical protein